MGLLTGLRSVSADLQAIGDSDSFTVCSDFGCNTYTITLADIVNNGDGTVTVSVDQDGDDGENNAIPTVTLDIAVASSVIYTETDEWFPSNHETHTATGSGVEGDAVSSVADTDDFGGGLATVSGTVPAPAFDPALVTFVDGSGSISPNPASEDETVSFSADITNDNASDVTFDLQVIDSAGQLWVSGTGALLAGETATFTLSVIPANVPVDPGDYTLQMDLFNVAEGASGEVAERVVDSIVLS